MIFVFFSVWWVCFVVGGPLREEIQAVLSAFNFSGFKVKVSNKLIKHYKSFVGRDFKAVAQCALFVFKNYFSNAEKCVWLWLVLGLICVPRIQKLEVLLQVFKISYCEFFNISDQTLCQEICKDFDEKIYHYFPDYRRKVKIHLLLHLVDCLFGIWTYKYVDRKV